MIVFQDVNMCIIKRPKVEVGELKYLVMGKNYSKIDLTYTRLLLSHQFEEDRFYLDPLMSNGLNSNPFIILGDNLEEDVLPIEDEWLAHDLRKLTLQILKDNSQWIESGNFTREEKRRLEEII